MKSGILVFLNIAILLSAKNIAAQIDFNNLEKSNCKSNVETQFYVSDEEGFCNRIIKINSDNTFMWSVGCENQTWISTGKWKDQGDSIILSTDKIHSNLICDVRTLKKEKSNYIKIRVLDKEGKPYTNFGFSLFNNEERLKDTIKYFYSDISQMENYADSNRIFTNNNGVYVIDKSGFKFLEVQNFSVLQGSRFAILTESIPAEIELITGFNAFEIITWEIQYLRLGGELRFFKSGTRLIDDTSSYTKFP